MAKKYDLDIPDYPGMDQVMELPGSGEEQEYLESKAEKISEASRKVQM